MTKVDAYVGSALADAAPAEAGATARAVYLTAGDDPIFAIHDLPDASTRSHVGVVIVPSFGWAELCTHRAMRGWAQTLVASGHQVLRFDLPGTGDSGGSARDPGRLGAWTAALDQAAAWLEDQGPERIVAVGIGLGGMLALHAVAAGAPVDDLVLWAVPSRGSSLMRELRAFAEMSSNDPDFDKEAAPQSAVDELDVAGFVLTAATCLELEQLDLTATPIPDPAGRRILMLGRDSLPTDRRLREHLSASGVTLTTAEGRGYAKMLTHPQFAENPREVYARTVAWLAAAPRAHATVRPRKPSASSERAELQVGGTPICETPFEFSCDGNRLAGVLSTPVESDPSAAPLTAVLLNAGAVRRIGPNRMWTEAARRWAALGIPTLRLDGVGLGDSDGDERRYYRTSEFYGDDSLVPVIAALDELESRDLPGRFLLVGLCSSAYWSLHAALADDRVRALILVNLWSFVWSDELAAARDARRARTLLRRWAWLDIVRIASDERRISRFVRTTLRRLLRIGPGHRDDVFTRVAAATERMLSQLRDGRVQTLLLLSDGEHLAEDLAIDGLVDQFARWPNLRYRRIPIADHIFRPVWAQRHVHAAFDDLLARALEEQRRAGRSLQSGQRGE